ncbi:conserved hypothetical protein [Methylomarinovum caldicuralii]|uniref:DUF1249 domain-containing protein n=2 Tax=Methylomarinovum caldicuralii TaxID=438856 RepID=A0AAU9CTN3_9GAMM|nr:conserved hypothetical protein [Methylomarinovum caldicuralii]
MGDRHQLRALPALKPMPSLKPIHPLRTLQDLCESNYRKLRRLIPGLRQLESGAVALQNGQPALHVRLLEKAPFTLTLELSYCFDHGPQPLFEPALRLRVYLDAGMVEVLEDAERPPLRIRGPVDRQVLEHKWQMNYFLDKWLDHCLQRGYRFSADDRPKAATANL